jgi:hypothetical protein
MGSKGTTIIIETDRDLFPEHIQFSKDARVKFGDKKTTLSYDNVPAGSKQTFTIKALQSNLLIESYTIVDLATPLIPGFDTLTVKRPSQKDLFLRVISSDTKIDVKPSETLEIVINIPVKGAIFFLNVSRTLNTEELSANVDVTSTPLVDGKQQLKLKYPPQTAIKAETIKFVPKTPLNVSGYSFFQ